MWNMGLLGASAPVGGGSYELIESVLVTGSTTSTVAFSSIPQTYKHLQLRTTARTRGSGDSLAMTFNGITSASYANHWLYGFDGTVSSTSSTSRSNIETTVMPGTSQSANIFSVEVMDILDYASTAKNTTIRSLNGYAGSSLSFIGLRSGFLNNTAAITSISLTTSAGLAEGSRFSLYGIK